MVSTSQASNAIWAEAPDVDNDDASRDWSTGIRSSLFVRLGIVVIVAIVIVAILLNTSPGTSSPSIPSTPSPPAAVSVSQIVVTSPDNACGLNGQGAGGYNSQAYGDHPVVWWLPEPGGSLPCTVSSLTTNATGFQISDQLPMTVTTEQTPIFVTIDSPASYSGPLYLTFN